MSREESEDTGYVRRDVSSRAESFFFFFGSLE